MTDCTDKCVVGRCVNTLSRERSKAGTMGSDKQSYFRRRSTNSKAYTGNEKATCKEGRRNDDTHSERQGRQAVEHGETDLGKQKSATQKFSFLLFPT